MIGNSLWQGEIVSVMGEIIGSDREIASVMGRELIGSDRVR